MIFDHSSDQIIYTLNDFAQIKKNVQHKLNINAVPFIQTYVILIIQRHEQLFIIRKEITSRNLSFIKLIVFIFIFNARRSWV